MKCPVCDFETEYFPGLARHVRLKHNETPCPICGAKVRSLVKHARRHNDERHQLLYRCLWHETRTKYARKRRQNSTKPNGGKKGQRTTVYLNRIADVMDKCKKEYGIRSCEFCKNILGCEIVKMLIERLAARV